jgi:membrane-bound lytic murein transglycosylase B
MPSSYLKFAEDYDGDGRRDIWSNPADVFASIANYLSSRGWTSGDSWGREVSVSTEAERKIRADVAPRAGTCQATRNMSVPLPSARWKEMGVRLSNGKPLPAGDIPLALVSGSTRHFLVTPNYDAILDYNCSHSYAITVALLGDAIASTGKVPAQPAPKSKSRPAGKAHPGAKKG